MGKYCEDCGKPTIEEQYKLCLNCHGEKIQKKRGYNKTTLKKREERDKRKEKRRELESHSKWDWIDNKLPISYKTMGIIFLVGLIMGWLI
jgi:uncharacterized membrane protein YvbJ